MDQPINENQFKHI